LAQNFLVFVVRRAINSVIALLFLILLVFALIHVLAPTPTDLARIYAASPHVPPAQLQIIIKQYNLAAPIPVQFADYVWNIFNGNFGLDTMFKVPELHLLLEYLPITLELVISGLVAAIIIGVFSGAIAAGNKGGVSDNGIRGLYLITWSSPPFLVAFLIQLVIAYDLKLLPAQNLVDPTLSAPTTVTGFPLIDSLIAGDLVYFWSLIQHLVLPAIAIAITSFGVVTRLMRSSMIEALDKDYVKLGYMKGLGKRQVVDGTAFRNAVIPIITLAALFFGTSTAGAVIIESIFDYHGMGWFTVTSISNLDYVAILGVTVIVGITVIFANFIADVLYGLADPRIRLE
jgi:ABC-type dipeptide/oligopeptide/nickel transport system permease component